MRWPRVRIWWLMAFIAAFAYLWVALPLWWNWHHKMLDRSQFLLTWAKAHERTSAKLKVLATFERTEAEAAMRPGYTGTGTPESLRKAAIEHEREAADWAAVVRGFCRYATFPWLSPYE